MNDFHQQEISTEVEWLKSRLEPLRNGIPVALRMDCPKRTGKRREPIVTFTPGVFFGGPANSIVISVLENGSTVVVADSKKIGNLVNAGMPAPLARVLMNTLNELFKD